MDGAATLDGLTQVDPEVRCFFITGESSSLMLRRAGGRRVVGVISKPFLLADLTDMLRRYVQTPGKAEPHPIATPENP